MSDKSGGILSATLTTVMVLCAAVTAGSVLWRTVRPPSAAIAPARQDSALAPADWEMLRVAGHRFGPSDARVTVLVFTDLECPACRQLHENVIAPTMSQAMSEVSIVYRHWPLSYHRQAYPAAKAAECAGEQGRFFEFVDVAFRRQSELGGIPWDSMAAESGVPSVGLFADCLSISDSAQVVLADRVAALSVGGPGTPTVVMNGVRLGRLPNREQFTARVDSLLEVHRKYPGQQ